MTYADLAFLGIAMMWMAYWRSIDRETVNKWEPTWCVGAGFVVYGCISGLLKHATL